MGVIGQLAGASTTAVADWATGVVEAAGRCGLPGCTGTEVLPQPPISSAASSAIPTIEICRCIRPSFRASSTLLSFMTRGPGWLSQRLKVVLHPAEDYWQRQHGGRRCDEPPESAALRASANAPHPGPLHEWRGPG